jgi:pyruvate/2-oxoglutarate dehydrogenase complex dihydrolipoamide acyltransferase (E2) component
MARAAAAGSRPDKDLATPMRKAARGRLLLASARAYLEAEAAPEAAAAASEAAPAAAEAEPAAAEAAESAAGAAAGAGAGAAAGAGAGAGSSFLPQAARAAAAISVARTSDFFISGFLLGMGQAISGNLSRRSPCRERPSGKARARPPQPNIIAFKLFLLGITSSEGTLRHNPSVVAGKAGVDFCSHPWRASRKATRRSGSPPQ